MNLTDWIALLLLAVALWGLTTSIPNWRTAIKHKADLKARGINGMNERLAQKETRLHRNITEALVYIAVLAFTVALPTIPIGGSTLSGLLLTLGLIYASFALAFWSRKERDDGESALREVIRIARERIGDMEAHDGSS